MSLNDQDLKNVRKLFVDAFDELWEKNLEPNMVTKDEFEDLKQTVATQTHVDARFDALDKSMTEHVTEPSIRRDRKLDEKTNAVAHKLGAKAVFTRDEVIEVERITPFAVKPATE